MGTLPLSVCWAFLLFRRFGQKITPYSSRTKEKLDEISRFQESLRYTVQEKAVLAYAEQVTISGQEVEEETYRQLKRFYTDDEIVELTALIAFQNLSSKFNSALKIPPQTLIATQTSAKTVRSATDTVVGIEEQG